MVEMTKNGENGEIDQIGENGENDEHGHNDEIDEIGKHDENDQKWYKPSTVNNSITSILRNPNNCPKTRNLAPN